MKKIIVKTLVLLRKLFVNSALLLVSCLFSLVLLEQGFRLLVFGWAAFDREALRNNVRLAMSSLTEASPHPEIYWALKPNLNTTLNFAKFQTNEFGLADQSYSRNKPDNAYRIAVLGDSYTMPLGVDTDKAYHALMERQLNQSPKPTGQKNYELINFGIGGFNLQRYNAVLKYLIPEWQPDALLIGYCGFNDHLTIANFGQQGNFSPLIGDGFKRSYLQIYFEQLAQTKKIGVPFKEIQLIHSDNYAYIDSQFAELRAAADAIRPNMPVLVAYLDNREHHPDNIRQLQEITARYGMYFVDTTKAFKGTQLKDYSLHILDSHPNARANELFAEQLLAAIKQNNWFGVGAH